MGRGRKGILDQSLRKPKILKNRPRNSYDMYCTTNKNRDNVQIMCDELEAKMRKMGEDQVREIIMQALAN